MMQRWREKLKYIEAGLIVTSLIMFVVSLFVDYENTGLECCDTYHRNGGNFLL
ncbi:MAG: hypothetical protein V8Q05_02690 [Lachnospiraceae bacterium]